MAQDIVDSGIAGSAEYVAYRLFCDLYAQALQDHETKAGAFLVTRDWILDTYAECLRAVRDPDTYLRTLGEDRKEPLHRSANMAEVSYLDGHIVSCENLQFYLSTPENLAKAEADESTLFMFKSPGNIMVYEQIRRELRELGSARNIVELGIARGGSAVFIDVFFKPERLVCLDLRPGVPVALQQYNDRYKSGIRAYPGVDQVDEPQIRGILEKEVTGPLDLVIDDASHFYEQTKISFEMLFPRLRPGGIYVIEDWDWFHHETAQLPIHRAWSQTSLSLLAIELMLAHGSYPALISKFTCHHRVLWVQRGGMPIEGGFSLSHYLNLRGKALPLL